MSKEEKSWDDIPSLSGLEVDWDFSPENPLGKRKYIRMNEDELTTLFEVKVVSVRVATEIFNATGSLNDISEGGISINLKKDLAVNQRVKVGFFLGKQKIISRAIVRRATRIKNCYSIGLQFQDLSEKYSRFIAGIYGSKILKR